jgi:hypothetical protein
MNSIQITENNYNHYKSIWAKFILLHPKGNIFQSPNYYSIFCSTDNVRPAAFLLIDKNDLIKGVLVCIIQYQLGKHLRSFTARSVVMGGPVTEDDNPEYAKLILNDYDRFIKGNAIYSQFRNINDISCYNKLFEASGYVFEEHLNILIDLKKDESELWQDIHPKRRNEIRKAEKERLTFKIPDTSFELEDSYKILSELYKSVKLPLYKKQVFEAVVDQLLPEGYSRIFIVKYEKTVVGTMFTFFFKGVVYNWYAGSDKAYNYKHPNDLLPWKIFQWAKEHGFTTFDWGGAGKPGIPYGVRDYKAKFGGAFVNYGRYEKIHSPVIFRLAKAAFKIWQALKF